MRSCRSLGWLSLLALSALMLLRAPSARAQGVIDMGTSMSDQKAKAHFKVGKSLYDAGRFAEAASEWEQAYQLSQKPELLYNLYVAYRDASDQPKAIDALHRYLDSPAEIEVDARANLQARLRALEEANSHAPGAPGEPASATLPEGTATTGAAQQPTPAPASAPLATYEEPRHRNHTASYVLLGVGGGLLASAVATGIVTSGKISRIEDHCPNDACPASYDLSGRSHDARIWRTITIALGGAGLVTAGVGAVLLLVRGGSGERDSAASPTADLACGASGCSAVVRGRF